MIEIGKSYRLARGDAEVEIIASGVDDGSLIYNDGFRGRFFVGITRNDSTYGDWVAEYDENGRRLWDGPARGDTDRFSLIVPPRLIDLNDATKQIRALAERLDISKDAAETVLEALENLHG